MTLIYMMWVVWKEQDGCVFQNTALQPFEVAIMIQEEIAQ